MCPLNLLSWIKQAIGLNYKMQDWRKIKSFPVVENYSQFSYASVPILIGKNEDMLIVSKRNSVGKSLPFLYQFSKSNLSINLMSSNPILELGKLGHFDEDGIMPVCSIVINNDIYLYYIGWNKAVSTPFRNSIGLAISKDNGNTFYKPFKGPLLDRSIHDPCFVASCCVIKEGDIYKMWYLSCDSWSDIDGVISHKYNIKYAVSEDAINWVRNGKIAIDYFWENEYAISVPRVIIENGLYKMWYSYRGNGNIKTYRIGYAESLNGLDWVRKDTEIELDVSENNFDSEMLCYPFIFNINQKKYMLYNGNGYGKTGFGIAVLEN